MKKILILIIIFAIFTISHSAYAAGYLNSGGIKPHGGYTTLSNKCKICHAIHGTDPGSQHLLPNRINSVKWGGCEQCHSEASPFAAPVVYSIDGYRSEHSIDGSASVIPDSTKDLPFWGYSPGLTPSEDSAKRNLAQKIRRYKSNQQSNKPVATLECLHCHSPHGNNVMGGPNILRWDPARDGKRAQTLTQFCADCHNLNYITTKNGSSHPMMNPPSDDIAWGSSSTCASCHRAKKASQGGQFPHQSIGADLLKAEYNGKNQDTVCLDCHRNSNWTKGVGITY